MTDPDLAASVLEVALTWAPGPVRRTSLDARLAEDLGYDSMALVELAVVLEYEFGLKPMTEADVLVAQTVEDVTVIVANAERVG